MSEDKFEEFLRREAQAYNAPPATAPRDEMWAAIEHSRTSARRDAAAVAPGTAAIGSAPARRRARYAPWIGMAATLLIGVGIGRFAMDRGPASLLQDPLVTVDSRSAVVDAPSAETGGEGAGQQGGDALDSGPDNAPVAGADRAVDAPRSMQAGPATTSAAGSRDGAAPASRAAGELSPTYEVASQRHLQRAEALVAVVAAAPRDPMMDSLTSLWARDVLSNTRLLLDSPVGDDPIRRRLLEDLENLLVQLVQRSGPAGEERELIDRTLQRTQLLTRLRTSASGT